MDPAWITAIAAAGTAAAGAVFWLARRAWRAVAGMTRFIDDYFGAPEHNGVPARPGVIERLAAVEQSTAKLAAQMEPNHGMSLLDVVHRTAADVADIKAEQAAQRIQLEQLSARARKGNPS